MRITKEADTRRNEILDASEKLFIQQGFDQTSTSDILQEVGIARGTLYYHFASKEEILDGIIARLTDLAVKRASAVANQKEIPILQRFTQTILQLNLEGEIGSEVMEQAHKPQNALMHQKMQEHMLAEVNPIITGLIEEGNDQGIFQTDYPKETTEMLMLYANTAFDTLAVQSEDERTRQIAAFIYNVERLLGMAKDALLEVIRPIFENVTPPSP